MNFRNAARTTPMEGVIEHEATSPARRRAVASPLTIVAAGSEVRLSATPDATIGELAEALGHRPESSLWIDGRSAEPDEALAAAGLVHGSTVDACPPSDRRTGEAPLVIRCVAGPSSGVIVGLRTGRRVLGRGVDATIRLDDSELEPYTALVDVDGAGSVTVTQLAGRTPATIDGCHVGDRAAELAPGSLLELGTSRLTVAPVAPPGERALLSTNVAAPWQRVLHRRHRARLAWSPEPIVVPAEPVATPSRAEPHLGWISTLFALAGGVAVAVFMRSVLFLVIGACAAVGAMVIAIVRWSLRYRRRRRERRRHDLEVGAFTRAVDDQRQQFAAHRSATVPTVDAIVEAACGGGGATWERRRDDDDAFSVALGWGPLEWRPVLDEGDTGAAGGRAPLAGAPQIVADTLTTTTVGAGDSIAVAGGGAALVRSMLVQLAVTTGPADWELVAVVDRPDDWSWCRWLPHGHGSPDETVIGADDAESVASALDRSDVDAGRLVVVLTDRPDVLAARTGPVRRFLGGGRPAALCLLVDDETAVPSLCTTVVRVGARSRARWTPDARVSPPDRPLHLVGVSKRTALDVARRLASLVDPEAPGTSADALPAHVALSDVLVPPGVPISAAVVEAWWEANDSPRELSAMLGIGDGAVAVDLVADGPHALVAGTTGSGKSELLRTMVAALAARYSPSRLNLVLVDYKGGSTFDSCALLPHTVGVVTDLDDQLAERALRSLRAELRWREQLLRDRGLAELADDPATAGDPDGAPIPRLVVVVDEFAALAAELPEFLSALVGIAQRGRSLGMHLVLATQRPGGVVSDDIRANTNLRLAMRLPDAADARDVVGDDAPSRFARHLPGRAMLRLGAQERIVFQAASCVSPARPPRRRRVLLGDGAPGGSAPRELDLVVRAICETADRERRTPAHRPWLEPLPAVLPRNGFDGSTIDDDAIGLLDLPDEQRRCPLRWEPADGNLALYGSRGSGTTSAMLAVVHALQRRRADRLHLYVVDTVGDERLDGVARLEHCAAVVRIGEAERLRRLIDRLHGELERRRTAVRAGDADIVWCVDGIGALCDADDVALGHESIGQRLGALLADGPAVGIAAVVAVHPGRQATTVMAACANRWLFHLDDPSDAVAAGARPHQVPPAIAGRMLAVAAGHPGQVVVPCAVEPPPASGPPGAGPAPIATLPPEITADELGVTSHFDRTTSSTVLALGVGFTDLEAVYLTVPDGEHVVVAGRPRSGSTSAAATISTAWRQCHPEGRVVHLGAGRGSTCAVLDHVSDRMLVVVDDAERFDDPDGSLAALIGRGSPEVCVVAVLRPEAARLDHTHWSRLVRRSRRGVVMTAGGQPDGDVIGELLPRRMPIAGRPGLAYLVQDGAADLVQIAAG